jgi:ribosomal protein L16/L10AE
VGLLTHAPFSLIFEGAVRHSQVSYSSGWVCFLALPYTGTVVVSQGLVAFCICWLIKNQGGMANRALCITLTAFLRTKVSEKAGAKRQKTRTFCRAVAPLPNLSQGDGGFSLVQNLRFDLVYLRLLRRAIKRSIRNYRGLSQSRHVWLNLRPGYPISKKGKNARMGKGHGAFFRWAIRLRPHAVFISFLGLSPYALKRVAHRLNYWLPVPVSLLTTQARVPIVGGVGMRMHNAPAYGVIY